MTKFKIPSVIFIVGAVSFCTSQKIQSTDFLSEWSFTKGIEGPAVDAEGVAVLDLVAERSVREWLRNQAAGGYVSYDPGTERFSLTEEQAQKAKDTVTQLEG